MGAHWLVGSEGRTRRLFAHTGCCLCWLVSSKGRAGRLFADGGCCLGLGSVNVAGSIVG
jgi:hypothetical protein